jgi:hypothetical protein
MSCGASPDLAPLHVCAPLADQPVNHGPRLARIQGEARRAGGAVSLSPLSMSLSYSERYPFTRYADCAVGLCYLSFRETGNCSGGFRSRVRLHGFL